MIVRTVLKFGVLGLLLWGLAWVYSGIPQGAEPMAQARALFPTSAQARRQLALWRERAASLRGLFDAPLPATSNPLGPVTGEGTQATDAQSAANVSGAQTLYRWRDAQGQLHFSDQLPEDVPGVERIQVPAVESRMPTVEEAAGRPGAEGV